MNTLHKSNMQNHKLTLAACTAALLVLTACGGGSSGTAVNDVVMYKYLDYDPVELPNGPFTAAEALAIGRDALAQRGIFVTKEECGHWTVPMTGLGVNHLITVSQTQVDSAQSLGYGKYVDKGELSYRACNYE